MKAYTIKYLPTPITPDDEQVLIAMAHISGKPQQQILREIVAAVLARLDVQLELAGPCEPIEARQIIERELEIVSQLPRIHEAA